MPKTKQAKPTAKAKKDVAATTSRERELKAKVKELRASLKKAEAQAEKWKDRAKARGAAVSDARVRMEKLEKKLAKAGRDAKAGAAPRLRRAVEQVKDISAEAIAVTATTVAPSASTAPDDSWTVTRLRAEARTKGVTGYSRMSKAQLLTALKQA